MKRIIISLLALVLTLNFSYGQKMYDSPVVKETNLSKSIMWLNLKKWVSSAFNNYKYVVDLEDKEAGLMIIKWNCPIPIDGYNYCISNGYLIVTMNSSITIEIKDNKYRYTVSDGTVTNTLGYLPSYDIKKMSVNDLETAMNELEFVATVGQIYFNNSLVWDFDQRIDNVISDYSRRLNITSSTTNKGKQNKEYAYLQNNIEYIKGIRNGYNSVVMILCKSLENNINIALDNF